MSVTFYKTRLGDPCLIKNECAVCLSDIAAKDGSAHIPSLHRYRLGKRPILEHAIHSVCLNEWIKERLSKNQPVSCPTCRASIILPLKDRVVRELKFLTKHALIGATLGIAGITSISLGETIGIPSLISILSLEITIVRHPNLSSGMPLAAFGGGMGAAYGLVNTAVTVLGGSALLFGATKLMRANDRIIKFIGMLFASIGITGALAGALARTIVKDEALAEIAVKIAGAAAGTLTISVIKRISAVDN